MKRTCRQVLRIHQVVYGSFVSECVCVLLLKWAAVFVEASWLQQRSDD